MHIAPELISDVERALAFDPVSVRRALVDRTPIADAGAGVVQRRLVEALGEGLEAGELAVDRLLTGCDSLNVSYLERGMIAADAVARIDVRRSETELAGCATGFMVSPRLLLTNNHVLPSAETAALSWADFRYEFDALGRVAESATFALDPSTFFFTDARLDVTVVAVAPESTDRRRGAAHFGWLRLSSSSETALRGEWLTVIHHPGGRPKQVCLRQNLLIRSTANDLWYATDTAPASSGAPVFNDSWQVVGVHRLGAPARGPSGQILTLDGDPWSPSTDESHIVWRASVATRTCTIVERLATACAGHPLVDELLREGEVDAAEAIIVPLGSGLARAREAAKPAVAVPTKSLKRPTEHASALAAQPVANGNGSGTDRARDAEEQSPEAITVTVPLRITVRAGNGGSRAPLVGVGVGS
jgi:V8-like Glu-specific endopeptidase